MPVDMTRLAEACEKVQKEYPEYTLQVAMDMDFSEINELQKKS